MRLVPSSLLLLILVGLPAESAAQGSTTNCQLYPRSVSCTTTPQGTGSWLGVAGAMFEGYARDQDRRRLEAAARQEQELTEAALAAARGFGARQAQLDAEEAARREAAFRLFVRRANLVRRQLADSLLLFDEAFDLFSDSSSAVLVDLFAVAPDAPIARISEELTPLTSLLWERHVAFMKDAAEAGQIVQGRIRPTAGEAAILVNVFSDIRTARLAARYVPLGPAVDSLLTAFKSNREACAKRLPSCNAALADSTSR